MRDAEGPRPGRQRPRAPQARWALLLGLGALAACSRPRPDATPEGAVRELTIHLGRYSDGDPTEAKAAFGLLSKEARSELEKRAERYSAASGKRIAPELMIAPASFVSRFEARELSSRIQGPYAVVAAVGLLAEERAEIPCVYEEGGWRVHLVLPPLSPVRVLKRDGETSPP
ncbi:MAG: hypothetical protein JNL21_21165 [Myxococcales bacterium]|nr:hypothetical protein [Myxococcales bacterium]